MAEVKNSFLSSKMNKDLDDRLIPNSEYRDALNISVGKSEQDNIGTVQNVLGNVALTKTVHNVTSPLENIPDLTCIGFWMDNQNNRIYQFLTNYTDQNPSQIILCDSDLNTQPTPSDGWVMKITVYDFNTSTYSTLVEGIFLNFSTTNLILGVNLVEGLLFWTDNRNQPRKINYSNAINNPNYYIDEVQISVAKYAPLDAPILFKEIDTTASTVSGLDITVPDATGIVPGMTLISSNVNSCDYANVLKVTGNVVTMYSLGAGYVTPGDKLKFLISTMSNQENNPTWPGDPAYLESKYVRFSYRFKFDDNEYSIFAPFSQIAYIPNQKGFFINGDEQSAYRSTVLKWLENNINNIELLITLPDVGSNVVNSYKIKSIDILYKESNSLAVKVVETIPASALASLSTNIYSYTYQSQKPYKTLAEDQITRVYDKIPVRALAQEMTGNRVIYGNFYTTYTAPKNINYNVSVLSKSEIFTNFIEYPNHTLKQNRNYQVGFVLSDKFGRQSPVILSSIDLYKTLGFSGSTVYSPYVSENDSLFPGTKCWNGNALVVLVNNIIDSTRNISLGTPGLYAVPQGSGFAISAGAISSTAPYTYTFTLDLSTPPAPAYPSSIPVKGDYLRGKYTDYVEVLDVYVPPITIPPTPFPDPPSGNYAVVTSAPINDLYLYNSANPIDIKFSYKLNQIGWYSYKVVVKQKEQDYYNVYLPGILNGYPTKQTSGSQVKYNDPSVVYTQIVVASWTMAARLITLTSGNTSLMKVGDYVTGIMAGSATTTVEQILSSTQFVIANDPPSSGTNVSLTIFRAPTQQTSTLENGINTTSFPVDELGRSSHMVLINDNINKVPRDLAEVGPDQKQYRSSVELYGRVQNEAAIATLNGDEPTTDYTATTITYTLAAQSPIADPLTFIKPGDGIQCVQAQVPVPNPVPPGGQYLPHPWYKNTVVVSNVVDPLDPTKGIITFTPSNVVLDAGAVGGSWKTFTITRAENIQYYPLRKADVVNTIAYATDFNFLSNTVDNIQGSAGLNFYQLQNNPLIGRISTSKSIGVEADIMLPTLGVYETRPVESMLDLFWETATTGYISDLNYDVNTGFDGASNFSPIGFDFIESQDPFGSGTGTGDDNSPYITNEFFILNNTNVPLTLDSCTLTSVYNQAFPTPTNFVTSFTLEPGATPDSYRIKLNNKDFMFNFDSPTTRSNFTFVITAVYSGITSILQFNGKLKNQAPSFSDPTGVSYNKTITQSTTYIQTLGATNGVHVSAPPQTQASNQDGLYFKIMSGTDINKFSLDPSTGALSLIDPFIPFGAYELTVRVQDAVSFATLPPVALTPINTDYGSKEAFVTFVITVGETPINDNLQYWNSLDDMVGDMIEEDGTIYPTYFAIYVGADQIFLDTNGHSPSLPNPPATVPAQPAPPYLNGWTKAYNVSYENGNIGGGFPNPVPLTAGAIRFKLKATAQYSFGTSDAKNNLLIYYRPSNQAPNNVWQLVKDENKAGSLTANWDSSDTIKAEITNYPPSPDGYSTVTATIKVSTPGEYCFAIRAWGQGNQGPNVIVEDANYYYNTVYPQVGSYPQYVDPFAPKERYLVGLSEFLTDYPNGIPYQAQTAINGFGFSTVVVATGTQPAGDESFTITPTADFTNGLITKGMWVNGSQITGVNIPTNTITIYPGTAIPSGTSVTCYESISGKPGGLVWVHSKDATHVKQFYRNYDFQTLWEPSTANRFYNFQNYNGNGTTVYGANVDKMAFDSAQVTETGKVTTQSGFNITGYSRNFIDPLPPYTYQTIGYNLIPDTSSTYRILDVYGITSTEATVEFLNLPFQLRWSYETTTPAYGFGSPDDSNFYNIPTGIISYSQTYTLTGLLPDTIYYIIHKAAGNQIIPGEALPYAFKTLPA